MIRRAALLALLVLPGATAAQQKRSIRPAVPTVRVTPGMVITRSVRIAPGTYTIPGRSLDSAIVTVRGDGITVDFGGATLRGIGPGVDPDKARGVAIRIEGGKRVTIRNARIHGYRVAIMARGTQDLTLAMNDLSYGWKPRLYSVVEHESLVDWLSFHNNEKDEWLRFGAAIYLADVHRGRITENRAEQGMNGLMMVRTDSMSVWNNRFSFNSGLGIGMYRSSDNRIVHNYIEFNVRGYSHGFYRRGQDSAGILMYEQCMRNTVAYNSATHGGDGLFIWAGQSTMDSGAGGVNDNIIYGNDFSYAPTNGMEATFSRNVFIGNRVKGNEYGLWGGYSYESRIIRNEFAGNRTGIAIEHGQDNAIYLNSFRDDSTAVRLWANRIEPSDWGYPKHRDTRSRDALIQGNAFYDNRVGIRAAATSGLVIQENRFLSVDSALVLSDTTSTTIRSNLDTTGVVGMPVFTAADTMIRFTVPRLVDGYDPDSSPSAQMDRSAIVVDEWGPFDWRSPKLWPVDSSRALPLRLRTLGPAGRWKVISTRGVASTSPRTGDIGDTITVTPSATTRGDWTVVLEYVGDSTVSQRGMRRKAGVPVRFSFSRFEPVQRWDVRVYSTGDSATRDTTPPDTAAVRRRPPILTTTLPRLDWEWYRPTVPGIPLEHWLLEATTRVQLPAGQYTLQTISDDGIRVWVDGKLVIQRWNRHGSEIDTAVLTGGIHDLRVQFYQGDGWTELRLDILNGSRSAGGSPGPH